MAISGGRHGRQGGFALVAVLAVTGLLAGLLVTMSVWARSSVATAAVARLDAETDALLRAGVNVAGFELFVRGASASMIDGQRLALDAGTITISVTEDGDKVDLNGSSAELLALAYRAAGLRAMPPETFAARVMDWRDADAKPEKNGAEDADYRNAGLPGPRNGPFHKVSDLGWVLGVSATDLVAIRPFVTVFNPSGKLDPYRTPAPVLSLLPGMTREILEQALSLRKQAPAPEATAKLRALFGAQASYIDFQPSIAFTLDLAVSPSHNKRWTRCRIVIIRSYDPQAPFRIVDWTELSNPEI